MVVSRFEFFLFLIVSRLCGPTGVVAAPGDEHWSRQFNLPGPTNNASAIALNNGRIYAAGFNAGGTLTNTTVSVWDGIQWSGIGTFYGSLVMLYDMAFVGSTLYVAGTFTNVNGVAIKGLARWDGSTWSSVGLTNTALSLAVEGNKLYVGGIFTNAGSVAMTNVGYWDGVAWQGLGAGLGISGSSVRALAVSNGMVYAGGIFTNTGPTAATNLATWNGSSWSAVGGGVNNTVFGVALKGSELYVTGAFTKAGALSANFVARWDGTSWSALNGG